GTLRRARVPAQLEPERVLHLDDTGAAEAAATGTAGARVGGEPVDVGEGEAGVGHRRAGGLDGEVDARAIEPTADGRLPDPRDHRLALERAHRASSPAGANSGR